MEKQHHEANTEISVQSSSTMEKHMEVSTTSSGTLENHVETPRPNHAEITQENIKSALHEIISEIDREMEGDFNEEVYFLFEYSPKWLQ